ncbi:MAG: hypothetical protein GOVbin1782_90 [Prokaryotic dsDNA virus sp.]|nr:MAG: hypothetical protein GOVbin1782_90 [Prokaryotic dsDNA virus sp.]|tara:strand:+ start:1184 stop:1495 length:312 start_codon:yes stop_codon:yes gene_type:complete
MTGIGGCRSSGGITADTQIVTGQGKLTSIHGLATVAGLTNIKVYDATSSAGASNDTLIGQLVVDFGLLPYAEADMHGVLFKNGLYADVTVASGSAATFTVEFI